jgi:heme/copper-type cytochrome/quinol oxidase subunit 2
MACRSLSPSYNRGMRKLATQVGLAIALVVLLAAADAVGCPNCKDGVNTSDPQGLNIARGYFYSILLMLAMPFTLAGTFAAYVWREMRRQKRNTEAEASGAVAGRTLP